MSTFNWHDESGTDKENKKVVEEEEKNKEKLKSDNKEKENK